MAGRTRNSNQDKVKQMPHRRQQKLHYKRRATNRREALRYRSGGRKHRVKAMPLHPRRWRAKKSCPSVQDKDRPLKRNMSVRSGGRWYGRLRQRLRKRSRCLVRNGEEIRQGKRRVTSSKFCLANSDNPRGKQGQRATTTANRSLPEK